MLPVSHWVDTDPDGRAAKMDVVVFGHIFQVRRGGVRGGMVVPWSCLGRVGNVIYGPP